MSLCEDGLLVRVSGGVAWVGKCARGADPSEAITFWLNSQHFCFLFGDCSSSSLPSRLFLCAVETQARCSHLRGLRGAPTLPSQMQSSLGAPIPRRSFVSRDREHLLLLGIPPLRECLWGTQFLVRLSSLDHEHLQLLGIPPLEEWRTEEIY